MRISVIVVTWRPDDGLWRCLRGLGTQSSDHFEIIVADNGAGLALPDRLELKAPIRVIHLENNLGPSAARNAGASAARGKLLLFLDDDAVPDPNWVDAFDQYMSGTDVVAARGRVLPLGSSWMNHLARGYDLGSSPRVSVLNTEGNSAVRTEALRSVGGFDPGLYGHEGVEFSTRLWERFGANSIDYTPDAVIFHDYAENLLSFLSKRFRHGRMMRSVRVSHINQANKLGRGETPGGILGLSVFIVRSLGLLAEGAGLVSSLLTSRRSSR